MTQFLSCILTVYIFVLCHASVKLRRLYRRYHRSSEKSSNKSTDTKFHDGSHGQVSSKNERSQKIMVENKINCLGLTAWSNAFLFLCTRALPMGDIRWCYCLKAIWQVILLCFLGGHRCSKDKEAHLKVDSWIFIQHLIIGSHFFGQIITSQISLFGMFWVLSFSIWNNLE